MGIKTEGPNLGIGFWYTGALGTGLGLGPMVLAEWSSPNNSASGERREGGNYTHPFPTSSEHAEKEGAAT